MEGWNSGIMKKPYLLRGISPIAIIPIFHSSPLFLEEHSHALPTHPV
jgi:hypothetical protein